MIRKEEPVSVEFKIIWLLIAATLVNMLVMLS